MVKMEENHEGSSGKEIAMCVDKIIHSSLADDAAKGNAFLGMFAT